MENVIGEIHRRLTYRNWYVRVTINDGKFIIVVEPTFFEKNTLKNIMEQYDYEYEVKFLDSYSSQK